MRRVLPVAAPPLAQGSPLRSDERIPPAAPRALAAIHPRLCCFFLGESKCAFPLLEITKEETAMKDLNVVQLIGRLGSKLV